MQLVEERPGLVPAIREVVTEAFDREDEARLVDRLRHDGDLVLSLVALSAEGEAVAHVAFSRLVTPGRALALAPLSVLPRWQRRGFGKALVQHGLELTRARGFALVFVLGDPGYYGRLGFSADAAAGFSSPYAGPHFMAHRLTSIAADSGAVTYPGAFTDLE